MAGMPQASFKVGSMLTLLDSSGSEVVCPVEAMARGNASSRALNSRPIAADRRPQSSAQQRRLRIDARIDAAAAIEPAFRIGIVEIMQDASHLHALVLVQFMLEHALHAGALVEHQILADHAARIGQALAGSGCWWN